LRNRASKIGSRVLSWGRAPRNPGPGRPGKNGGNSLGRSMATELEDELHELRREVIESRGLVIKTNNLTNALAADLKAIAKRQVGYERRISWNSAAAYVVFVLVVLLGVKILWDYRRENLQDDGGAAKAELA